MAVAGKFEVASGVIDGVNTVFSVSAPYVPLSVNVFLNGQLKRKDFADGWVETNPATGVITLGEPPIDGDVVQVFFVDGSPNQPSDVVEVCPLVGTLVEVEVLAGSLVPTQELAGVIVDEAGLAGSLVPVQEMAGVLNELGELHGVIAEVCE